MAALFGTGIAADAFTVAWRFPNLFRYLFGENSFTAAFLPKFTEVKHKEGPEAAFAMASAVLTALLAMLIFVCAMGMLFAPYLIELIAIGWKSDSSRMGLSTELVRILFGFIGFLGLASYCQAILNTYRRFFISSVAPAFLNLSWLIGVGAAGFFLSGEIAQIKLVAAFIVIGGLLQFLWQFIWVIKTGWKFSWALRGRWRDVVEVGFLLLPSLLALASHEINFFADVMLASLLPGGSISSLSYGSRLMYLPLSLIGYSMATASLPTLSETAAENREDEFVKTLSYTARSVFTVLMPVALMTIALRFEIVGLLFERGSFSAGNSTPMVAWALMFYIIGLPFHGLTRTLTQAFYARKDTRTPIYITALGVVFNIELSIILMQSLAHGGLALGSSITGIINATLLFYYIRKKLPKFDMGPILTNAFRVTIAGGIAAALTWLLKGWLNPYLDIGADLPTRFFQLIVPAAVFFGIFFLLSRAFRIREVNAAFGKLAKRFTGRFRNR